MTHLMRLELKKVGLKKYVIFSMIGIFISMYFLFVGLNDSSTIKSNYETAFSTVGMIFCVYYITLFSVLVATYIINESRSAIYRRRSNGLKKLKTLLKERN